LRKLRENESLILKAHGYAETLTTFISSAADKGHSKAEIKKVLLAKNWPEKVVNTYTNMHFKK